MPLKPKFYWPKTPTLLAIVLLGLSGCATVSEQPIKIALKNPPPVLKYALSLQGTPYNYGGDNPDDGFDCSGFVKHVYERQGIKLPRRAYDMALALPVINKDQIRSGDLVFFNVDGRPYSHVGIYLSNTQFIHAPSEQTGRVLVSTLNNSYWQQRYSGVRRPRN